MFRKRDVKVSEAPDSVSGSMLLMLRNPVGVISESHSRMISSLYVVALDQEVVRMRAIRRVILQEPEDYCRPKDCSAVALEDQALLSPFGAMSWSTPVLRDGPDGQCVLPGTYPAGGLRLDTSGCRMSRFNLDPAQCRLDLIKDLHWRDVPGRQSKGERLTLRANYACWFLTLLFIRPLSPTRS